MPHNQKIICGLSGKINVPAIILLYKDEVYNNAANQPVRSLLIKLPILKISQVPIAADAMAPSLTKSSVCRARPAVVNFISRPTIGG